MLMCAEVLIKRETAPKDGVEVASPSELCLLLAKNAVSVSSTVQGLFVPDDLFGNLNFVEDQEK